MSSVRAVQTRERESGEGRGGRGGRRVRLTQLSRGQVATLEMADLDAESRESLRAMGLRPECALRMCKRGEPCIVSVCTGGEGAAAGGCRIALAKRLADHLHVRPC